MPKNHSTLSKPGTIRLANRFWPMLRALMQGGHRAWLERAIEVKYNREQKGEK